MASLPKFDAVLIGEIQNSFAAYFALYHKTRNHWALILVMLLAGMVGGSLWGLLPGCFIEEAKGGTGRRKPITEKGIKGLGMRWKAGEL